MDDAAFQDAIRVAMTELNASTEQAIRREIDRAFELEPDGRLQFEVSAHDFAITLVQTEETVLEGSAIDDALPGPVREAALAADFDLWAAIDQAILPWFAQRWRAAGGPERYRPAYAFFHEDATARRFDLEREQWYAVDEVWPAEG